MKSLSFLHPCGKESTGLNSAPKYFSGTLAVSLIRAGFPIKEGIKQSKTTSKHSYLYENSLLQINFLRRCSERTNDTTSLASNFAVMWELLHDFDVPLLFLWLLSLSWFSFYSVWIRDVVQIQQTFQKLALSVGMLVVLSFSQESLK